jgi:hypothetical protein
MLGRLQILQQHDFHLNLLVELVELGEMLNHDD